jgi:molybdopterin-biosynthesis enzyme MoeA-like protein
MAKEVEDKVKLITSDVKERFEIGKRKCNLVFHGIAGDTNNDDDAKAISDIIGKGLHLDPNHIENVQRIGKEKHWQRQTNKSED